MNALTHYQALSKAAVEEVERATCLSDNESALYAGGIVDGYLYGANQYFAIRDITEAQIRKVTQEAIARMQAYLEPTGKNGA